MGESMDRFAAAKREAPREARARQSQVEAYTLALKVLALKFTLCKGRVSQIDKLFVSDEYIRKVPKQ